MVMSDTVSERSATVVYSTNQVSPTEMKVKKVFSGVTVPCYCIHILARSLAARKKVGLSPKSELGGPCFFPERVRIHGIHGTTKSIMKCVCFHVIKWKLVSVTQISPHFDTFLFHVVKVTSPAEDKAAKAKRWLRSFFFSLQQFTRRPFLLPLRDDRLFLFLPIYSLTLESGISRPAKHSTVVFMTSEWTGHFSNGNCVFQKSATESESWFCESYYQNFRTLCSWVYYLT